MIAPRTSRNVNKHFPNKRITMRQPALEGEVKGKINSVDELIYWFQKFHYVFYTHTFNVIHTDGSYDQLNSLDELSTFLKENVEIKSGKLKGQLPISIVRSIYNSGDKDSHRDVSRDVFLAIQGAEDYLPCPSVDDEGKFISEAKRENIIKCTFIKKS